MVQLNGDAGYSVARDIEPAPYTSEGTIMAIALERMHIIWFHRGGDNHVEGWLRIRGGRADDYELTRSVGRGTPATPSSWR